MPLVGDNISRAYMICSSPRTGSNLLCGAMRQIGIVGNPHEYFEKDLVDERFMRENLGIPSDVRFTSFSAWMGNILRAGTTKNGVFGLKIHWSQVDNLLGALQGYRGDPLRHARPVDALRAFFPNLRFIWLRRQNVIAQGISFYRAVKTNRWAIQHFDEDNESPIEVPFDVGCIEYFVQDVKRQEENWRTFLEGADDITLALTYEALVADFEGTAFRVVEHIGVPLPVKPRMRPRFRKQADDLSREWEHRWSTIALQSQPDGGSSQAVRIDGAGVR